jgi:tocopherol cyclase
LLQRIRNIWTPEAFHYHHRLGRKTNVFEGWYLKLVDVDGLQPYAFIPGVFLGDDAHAFVQVLDGKQGKSWYVRFSVSEFNPAVGNFDARIGPNRFNRAGITLDIEWDEPEPLRLKANVKFGENFPWPVTATSPGVMGPYAFIPTMECNHGILSLDHSLEGTIETNGQTVDYHGGRGYIEKDWGKSFPEGYVWTQSNHFDEPGICVTASVAKIPWLTGSFRGFLVGFLHDGELHRFTTYNGSKVESLRVTDHSLHLVIRNRTHTLEIESAKTEGAMLMAPYEKQMLERVAETMTSTINVECTRGNEVIYEGQGNHGCLETQGNLPAIVDSF